MKAHLLPSDDSRWTTFLAANDHDFFHLPGYVALTAQRSDGVPCALYVEDGARALLLPLLLRDIPQGGRDAVSPYGYPGPATSGAAGRAFVQDALAAGVQVLSAEGVISMFVRMHPILNRQPPHGPGTLVLQGDTVAIDLSDSREALWRQTRRGHRTQIRQASRAGYVASWDDDWSHLQDFQRLHHETMVRRDADEFYFFDESYFDELRAVLGDRLRLMVTTRDGAVAAAGLFVDTNGIVQYFLSGSDASLQREAAWATKLMIHEVRTWAQDAGRAWLHLGGGVGASADSLLHFKAGFSLCRLPYYTLRTVVNRPEYERLARERDATAISIADDTGYFPAYRRP